MKIFNHDFIEQNSWLMIILVVLVVAVGGLVEIVPLYFQRQTTTPVEGMKPYEPLRLVGRDIYIREGCYNCHSQMVRSLVGDVLRYGPSGRLGESVYDHPFQWGSKRTGPDLAREGGKYPNIWHFQHFENPRSTSIGSNMPAYPWLYRQAANLDAVPGRIDALRVLGVPFAQKSPEEWREEALAQGRTIVADLAKSGVEIRPDREVIALIAYMQQLGKSKPVPAATPAAAPVQAAAQP